jgi:hypothetical protein
MMSKLTGKIRVRSNWRGKLILQVEKVEWYSSICKDLYWWEDAKVQDLATYYGSSGLKVSECLKRLY